MRTFSVVWSSPKNIVEDCRVMVRAENLVEAQNKFFGWLQKHPVYQHMWALNMQITEAEYIEEVIE